MNKYILYIIFLVSFSFVSANVDKASRLAELLGSSDEQERALKQTCEVIETNWDQWMDSDSNAFYHFPITDKTYVTVHPAAAEVCIFLEGHSIRLGEGAFKSVVKGVSYSLEEEIAIAIPHEMIAEEINTDSFNSFSGFSDDGEFSSTSSFNPFSDSSFYSESWNSSDQSGFSTEMPYIYYPESWNSSDQTTSSCYDFREIDEFKMLEAVQGCRGVIKVYFASFHTNEVTGESLPVIVGKYYNGGTFSQAHSEFKGLSFEKRLSICHDLLMALNDIHSKNIVHGDIHGGNVLFQRNPSTSEIEQTLLADFGLAFSVEKYKKTDQKYFKALDIRCVFYLLQTLFKKNTAMTLYFSYGNMDRSAEEIYQDFLSILPSLVKESSVKKIMENAKFTKRMKLKRGNVIKWV